jgi:xanthine dehydrogenase YagT iron-sulfur-binding subunit
LRKGWLYVKDPDKPLEEKAGKARGFSRRGFIRGTTIASGALGSGLLETAEAQTAAAVAGPGPVAITLNVNGKPRKVEVEPRETLLDTLRNKLDLTAAKRVCDRGTCGACTVLMNGKAVYGCTVLAIDAQGKRIETLEGISPDANPHPVAKAFVNNDAQQCGYCTPGFVVAAKAFLDRNPKPTEEQVKQGLGGNLCRCGTYMGIRKAVLEAAGVGGNHNA